MSHLPDFVRLFLRLLGDRGVPFMAKAILVSGIIYAISPLDFLPDMMPLLGQVDDLSIFIMACRAFIQLCPRLIVERHIQEIDRTGEWKPLG